MAALPPAGVTLQAKGFSDYIKKLDAIDKKQREAFEAEFKGTGKSFAEVTKLAKQYERELDAVVQAEKRAEREAQKLAQAQVKAADRARKAQQKQAQAQQKQAQAQQQARRGAVGQIIGGVGGAALAGGPAGLAIAAAQELNEFRKESIELSRIQAKAEAQLSAAIRSTGGVAGLTANELKAQASALQDITNFGDEATIAAQAQLLTFTKIGSDVFPRATKSILDLATRMDGDLKGATIQVGKALNDPIAGLTALSRSGVQFSTQQKELVKGFVETNNISAAQVIILKELETQFGGSAEAAREADGGNIALSNSFGDLQEELGEVFIAFGKIFNTAKTGTKIIGFLQERVKTLQQVVAFAGAGFAAFSSIVSQTFDRLKTTVGNIGAVIKGEAVEPIKSFSQILDTAGDKAIDKFKEVATIFGETFDEDPIDAVTNALGDQADAAKVSEEALKAYANAVKQAEQLQLSLSRAAEDTALKLARANEDIALKSARATEDIARKQADSIAKLEEQQQKDRDRLLDDQIKQLDDFEKNRKKQIAKAEDDIRKVRQDAAEKQKRDQQKLLRDLAQAQARFDLDQLQSKRRFDLQESRLRAEGDILGLRELREDFGLQQQEEKENFDLSKKEQISGAKEQQREQSDDLEKRLDELKGNLDNQRAELLSSFDEQLIAQQQAQAEARIEQQRGFDESAAVRAIALAREEEDRRIALEREEEDRRISQARQLEDLGRSLAEQQDVTAEGSLAIANELEKVFGIDGIADSIMTGFEEKTTNDFKDLFDDLESIVSGADLVPEVAPAEPTAPVIPIPPRLGGEQEFDEGGIVGGPIGSPQTIRAHAGETVLPTHTQSLRQALGGLRNESAPPALRISRTFQMAAPIVPSQNLNVMMGGEFNIKGGEGAGEAAVQAAVVEMTESFRIAVNRLRRRN